MLQSPSKLPAPGRLFLPGCAIAAGLLAVSSPVLAAPTLKARPKAVTAKARLSKTSVTKNPLEKADWFQKLRIGKSAYYPLSLHTTFTLESGAQNVFCEVKNGTLSVKALAPGEVRMRLDTPKEAPQIIRLNLVESSLPTVEDRILTQVVERAPSEGTAPVAAETTPATAAAPTTADTATTGTATADTTTTPATPDSAPDLAGTTSSTASNTSEMLPSTNLGGPMTGTVPNTVPDTITGVMPSANASGTSAPLAPSALSADLTGAPSALTPPAPALPALTPPDISVTNGPNPAVALPATAPAVSAPQISPILPAPSRNRKANVNYRTSSNVPKNLPVPAGKNAISVNQGLARLLTFPNNILAVFFSDPAVMDARAINARTIAVTGIGAGPSTLAVFTSRYPGDAIGQANIYRIQTTSRSSGPSVESRDPRVVQDAITTAIGDPRIRTTVYALPDGSLAARLAGTVRNASEVQAATTAASFFVPQVVAPLFADPNAPSLDAVLSGSFNATPESGLQEKLRRITGNDSIELLPLPTGLAFKAEVNSNDEAEALLRMLPSLNQQVIPFIVVRGQPEGGYYAATVPLLNGEDRQLTQKLHDVTGIRTAYAVRTASNSLAAFGTVRTRSEYDTVRRFMMVMAQSSVPPAVQGTSQGGATLRPQGLEGPIQRAYNPTGGYLQNLGLQMFVRITDPGQSVIRKVTVETSVVEISRTALKDLGVQYGSSTLSNEQINPGTTTPVLAGGNPVIGANGQVVTTSTPGTLQRTVNPSVTVGTLLAGNGFLGTGGFSNIDPFRTRLTALANKGDAHLLASPNVTAMEGSSAQITIGGERPVPKVVATQGAVGTQVEFRRYGVIISMRPTVSGDNTIILQIRADITQPDRTYEINLNGALIPGETVRSIDTVMNVRPGDTIVMGGLITNDKRQQTSKVPVLGDLPIIGALFKSKRFENNETELAIFMTPRIDSMPADMGTIEDVNSSPSFPVLPSRQEGNAILFQETTRSGN
jgi:Flp pilus assembly secretin CpaC